MKRIATTALVLTTTILACGCGAEAEATTTTDISPKEPTPITTEEVTETEVEATETEAESITEDISISESEAKEMLKAYSDKISEADIESYYEEIVYAFTTNINEGRTAEEAFNFSLQHAIELKAYDEEVAQAEKAKHDAEAREAEANKLAEQAKESETPTENGSTGTDGSVPVTKEVAEQQPQQTVEQPQPQTPPPVETPQPTTPAPTQSGDSGLSLEERQAMADRANERTAKITDPNDPEYGVEYFVSETPGTRW